MDQLIFVCRTALHRLTSESSLEYSSQPFEKCMDGISSFCVQDIYSFLQLFSLESASEQISLRALDLGLYIYSGVLSWTSGWQIQSQDLVFVNTHRELWDTECKVDTVHCWKIMQNPIKLAWLYFLKVSGCSIGIIMCKLYCLCYFSGAHGHYASSWKWKLHTIHQNAFIVCHNSAFTIDIVPNNMDAVLKQQKGGTFIMCAYCRLGLGLSMF